jgi:hypothetical protein
LRVTDTVAVVLPSATTEPGEAVAVELPAFVTSAVNVTPAVCVTESESVVSVAEYVTLSARVLVALNVATPEAFVVALAGAIVDEPPPCPTVTDLPGTPFPWTSFNVTVIVVAEVPFALTEAGEAETVESPAVGAPAVNVTPAV